VNAGFATRNNSIIAFLASAGGGTQTLSSPSNTETVLAPFTGPNALSTITFLAGDGLVNTGTLSLITRGLNDTGAAVVFPPGRLTSAAAGTLILVFDVNFLQAGADANSQLFTANLIAYLAAPTAVPVSPLVAPSITSIAFPSGPIAGG
jgi:hypothetical protein